MARDDGCDWREAMKDCTSMIFCVLQVFKPPQTARPAEPGDLLRGGERNLFMASRRKRKGSNVWQAQYRTEANAAILLSSGSGKATASTGVRARPARTGELIGEAWIFFDRIVFILIPDRSGIDRVCRRNPAVISAVWQRALFSARASQDRRRGLLFPWGPRLGDRASRLLLSDRE